MTYDNLQSSLEPVYAWLTQNSVEYAINVLLAVAVFWIGKRIARLITNGVIMALRKNGVELELISFVDSFLYWSLFIVVTIAALGQLGIETASFLAILGAAGLAIGLALQGSLSNFAAGVLIIMLRPFGVKDWVEIAGEAGSVKSIRIFTTELRTGDNKAVIIPNSRILNSNIINYTVTGTRRVDMVFGIGYDDDLDQAKKIIQSILDEDPRIHDDPPPAIFVAELGANSVDFAVRPWVDSADYWAVKGDVTEQIKKRFDDNEISIPYPQSTITYGKGVQPVSVAPESSNAKRNESKDTKK